jgi:DNA-binding transcriptional regulator YdaS (Cro superfamily)
MTDSAVSAFDKAVELAGGSYTAVAKRFSLGTGFSVSKWRTNGVPAERVLDLCRFTEFRVTPHQLRPDLYPNPSDGLPPSLAAFRGLETLLDELQIVRPDERAALSAAFDRGEEHLHRAIEALEHPIEVRAQLLAAAQRCEERAA